jgi:hypothetical protein
MVSQATELRNTGKEGPSRRATEADGIAELPPLATTVSNCLLPEYRFRLPVLPKGSFFSILLICTVVGDHQTNKLEKLVGEIRQRLTT